MLTLKGILELTRRRRLAKKTAAVVFKKRRTKRQRDALALRCAEPLSLEWLVQRERHFSSERVSVQVGEDKDGFGFNYHYGADRMALDCNAYAADYAYVLSKINTSSIRNVLEVGILAGTGLAIWSEIFPNSFISGIDIDISTASKALPELMRKGAFRSGTPHLIQMDVMQPDVGRLKSHTELVGTFDFVVDDGPHTHDAIDAMARALLPLMSRQFTYVIEDNVGALRVAQSVFSGARDVRRVGGLIVASN